MPPRNDTVLLSMGTSLDSQFRSTARQIPVWLKCLLVLMDAELSVTGHLASVQTFGIAVTHQTAGMVNAEKRDQHPIDCLPDGHSHCKPLLVVGTTFIVLTRAKQGAVHLVLLTPQLDSMWWYLSNRIDHNVLNRFSK